MEVLKLKRGESIPENFTGIIIHIERGYPVSKCWYKEGKIHRTDGPAFEHMNGYKEWRINNLLHRIDGHAVQYFDGQKEWWIDEEHQCVYSLEFLITTSIFLGIEKGKYDLPWLRFMTEEGIKEFPIIPGMGINEKFIVQFGRLKYI